MIPPKSERKSAEGCAITSTGGADGADGGADAVGASKISKEMLSNAACVGGAIGIAMDGGVIMVGAGGGGANMVLVLGC